MTDDFKKTPSRRRAVTILMVGGYINNAIIIIQGLLLIPLYLHFIGERLYGLWLATGGILAWLGFMDMGLGSLMIQRVSSAYGQRNFKQATEYFVNGLVVFVFLVLLFCISIFTLSYLIPGWLSATGPEIPLLRVCFQLAGLASAAELLNNCLRGFSQALQRPLFTILCMIAFRILGLTAIIILLFHNYNLWALPIGLLINAIPVLLLNFYYSVSLTRQLGGVWKIDKTIIRDFYCLSPVMLAGRMGSSLVASIEPTIIAIVSRPELATAYIITKRAADMIVMLIQVISASIFPSFSHLYSEGNTEKFQSILIMVSSLSFSIALITIGTYLTANEVFVQLWVGIEQFLGIKVTLLISIGSLIIVVNHFLNRFLTGSGDLAFPSLLILAEAVTRVTFMAILLYRFDIIGLPMATITSCSICFCVYYKRLKVKLPLLLIQGRGWLRSLLLIVAVFSIGYIVALNAPNVKTWLGFGVYACLVSGGLLFVNLLFNPTLRSFVVLLPPRFLFKQKEN